MDGAIAQTTTDIVSGTVSLSVPGVGLSAGFSVSINTTSAPVDESFDVAGNTVVLSLPAGPYLRVEGTHITVTILSQTFTADVVVEQATGEDGTSVTSVGLNNVDLALTSGGFGMAITGGSGVLISAGTGVAARITGTVAVTLPAGISVSGLLSLAINTTFAAVDTTVNVGDTTLSLTLPSGPYLRFDGIGLNVREYERLSADLIVWLTTVDASGQPQSTPVWFWWDGSTFLIYLPIVAAPQPAVAPAAV